MVVDDYEDGESAEVGDGAAVLAVGMAMSVKK